MRNKLVYIVILNFNGKADTIQCLLSLKKLTVNKDYTVKTMVVDNNSEDDSLEVIAKKFPEAEVIANSENLGFAAGNNIGMNRALENGADYVLLLNNDTEVEAHSLQWLLDAAERHSLKGGVFCPKIYFAAGSEFHKERYEKNELGKVIWFAGGSFDWANILGSNIGVNEVDTGQYDEEKEMELATGCCVLLTKELLLKLQGFDERYFMYYEDADLSMRAQRAGFSLMYVPQAKIWHINAGSSGSGSNLQDYFISRNRLLFGLTYAGLRAKVALIKESWRLMRNGREWQKKGVKDFYLRRFGKGSFEPKPKL